MKRKIIAAVAVLGLLAAGAFAFRQYQGGQAGGLEAIKLAGHIETTETDLAFKVPGKVALMHFDEGDQVEAGQLVAELEDQDLRQDVALAEARLAAAQATLEKLVAGSRPQDVKEAQAALAQARADLEDKARDLKRQEALTQRAASPQATLDKARLAHTMAQEAVARASERHSLLKEGFRSEDIAAGRADLNQAKAALELARTRLGYARLISPARGVVLVRQAQPGEVLAVGAPVVTLGDLDGVWLEGYIPETQLALVRLGQKAHVTTDTYAGKRYPARVAYISSKAEFTPKTVETQKERVTLVYRTKVRADNLGLELKPGMPGEAIIPLEPAQAATTGRAAADAKP
ncbi:MAG: efflux RND transporter periplasmic adaptor subunit [Desulfarculus sp.]|nr:efflux RND transporter periplasmic adaptor subunit [Desulfarculus sp.]